MCLLAVLRKIMGMLTDRYRKAVPRSPKSRIVANIKKYVPGCPPMSSPMRVAADNECQTDINKRRPTAIARIVHDTRSDADVAVVSNPESLREGAAIQDFKTCSERSAQVCHNNSYRLKFRKRFTDFDWINVGRSTVHP
jgi:hypothetical protein